MPGKDSETETIIRLFDLAKATAVAVVPGRWACDCVRWGTGRHAFASYDITVSLPKRPC